MTNWTGKPQEGFIRPDHNDFATSAELKAKEFSGSRANSLTGDWELWVLGEVVRTVSEETRKKDPTAIYKAHVDYFQLDSKR